MTEMEGLAKAAPFGRGDQTVLDEKVRRALQIQASDLDLSRATEIVIEPIKVLNAYWEVRPYKVHIYKEGDFFSEHRDTPHDSLHIATAVWILPASDFEGGELKITTPEQGTVYLPNRDDPTKYNLAIFYTDCLHSVSPVTKGTRVSIQFDILYMGPKSLQEIKRVHELKALYPGKGILSKKQSNHSLKNLLLSTKALQDPGPVAFLLLHHYPLDSLDLTRLRGFDSDLYRILGSSGVRNQRLVAVSIFHKYGEYAEYDVNWKVSLIQEEDTMDGPILIYTSSAYRFEYDSEEGGYTGNEAVASSSRYVAVALVGDSPGSKVEDRVYEEDADPGEKDDDDDDDDDSVDWEVEEGENDD